MSQLDERGEWALGQLYQEPEKAGTWLDCYWATDPLFLEIVRVFWGSRSFFGGNRSFFSGFWELNSQNARHLLQKGLAGNQVGFLQSGTPRKGGEGELPFVRLSTLSKHAVDWTFALTLYGISELKIFYIRSNK